MESRMHILTLGVADLRRSYAFYHQGLGFPCNGSPDEGIVFLATGGTRLALYPLDRLAEDIDEALRPGHGEFSGITLAHVTRQKEEVEEVLALAERCGGVIVKPAQDAFWGGYHGYFSDPDGYHWEVAYADFWRFGEDGSLVV